MGKSIPKSCHLCGEKVVKGGARQGRRDNPLIFCEGCLDAMYPGREGASGFVDKDGNVYFVDSQKQKVVVVFHYGPVPYSSYTEIDATDDMDCSCEGFFIR